MSREKRSLSTQKLSTPEGWRASLSDALTPLIEFISGRPFAICAPLNDPLDLLVWLEVPWESWLADQQDPYLAIDNIVDEAWAAYDLLDPPSAEKPDVESVVIERACKACGWHAIAWQEVTAYRFDRCPTCGAMTYEPKR